MGNYHPLVWLTYMAGVSVFGDWPVAFHGFNLFCHIGSTLLRFAALRRLTYEYWLSFWVAALWGIHPLNVEPVAWVSERKGILATFFGMLALWAYAVYAARPSWRRYLPVALAYAAGLLSKPSVVTLPVLLLLTDWWPLGRMGKVAFGRLLAEKLPLLLLALGASVLAVRTQAKVDALPAWPLAMRLDNVAASYWWYVAKALYPVHLAVFYPYRPMDARLVVAEWAGLLVLSRIAFGLARRAPFLLFGWLWYIVSLLPVCGLVQVGQHVHADRYAYIPLVGLLVSLVWGLSSLARHRMALFMPAALACLAILSWFQLGTWKSTIVLWQHAVRVTGGSSVAHTNLGDCLLALGQRKQAIEQYQSAIACDPDYAPGQYWLGVALLRDGRPDEAIPHLAKAMRLRPWEPSGPVTLAQAQKAIVVSVP
jgi:tetratricopeptide (TPR) repeat protein